VELDARSTDDTMKFLEEPPASEAVDAVFAEDREGDGYVSNFTRLWCWRPDVFSSFTAFRSTLMDPSELTNRDRAVLVTATAAERHDSYCSLAWGARLAKLSDPQTAAQVIGGDEAPALTEREAALAAWARQVVKDPNATTEEHIAHLRAVGLGDREIFEATAFIALRLAFSTINDALGASPDKQLADGVPAPVRAAVNYGRTPSPTPSRP
jgi:uncharacterized peroxidase-related enzyme